MTSKSVITDQACDWYERLHSDRTSMQEVAEFNVWLEADPNHRKVFEKVDRLWLASKGLRGTREVAESRVVIERLKGESEKQQRFFRAPRKTKAFWPMAAAAVLLMTVVAGWVTYNDTTAEIVRYYTPVGEQKNIKLDDGSSIVLNTNSILDVEFDSEIRRVVMIRGQANFNVAKDTRRPFTVVAGDGRVTALGTEFDVYMAAFRTVVTLMEGSVQVDWPQEQGAGNSQAPEWQAVRLKAGQQVEIRDGMGLTTPVVVNRSMVKSWLNGKLSYDEQPLAKVVEEANRYTKLRIELGDSALANIPVTGIFTAGENRALASALANLYGLELRSVGEYKIVMISPNQK